MFAGFLLGPAGLNLVHYSEGLRSISDLAVFLIILSAGMEMNLRSVIDAIFGRGAIITVLGFFLPLAAGIATGVAFGLDMMRTLFLGLCISITALPVAIGILESFKLLDTDIAKYSIAAAVANDVIALLILGVILDLPQEVSLAALVSSIGLTGGKLVAFVALVFGVNELLARIQRRAEHRQTERLTTAFGSEALFGAVILFVLVFASVTEVLGFHFVIGAFFGALLINREIISHQRYAELKTTLASVTNGFLAPVFFAALGLEFSVGELRSAGFVATVLIVSVVSKVIAGWMGARAIKLPRKEALAIGFVLNGRGIMELVIASIAFQHNFIGQGLFSTLVLMGVVTTMLTPLLLKRLFP